MTVSNETIFHCLTNLISCFFVIYWIKAERHTIFDISDILIQNEHGYLHPKIQDFDDMPILAFYNNDHYPLRFSDAEMRVGQLPID